MAMTLNVNIDDKTMQRFDTLCGKSGMDGGFDDPFYSPDNMARHKESIAQLDSGKGVIHEINYDV